MLVSVSTTGRFTGWSSLIVGEASLNLLLVMPPRIAELHVFIGWLILDLSSQPFFRHLMLLMVGVGHHLSLLAT